MRLNRLSRYILYSLIVIFALSRMWISFREYQDIQYSPVSTIATILLIFIALVPSVFLFKTLVRSGLNAIVLAFMIVCLLSSFIYGGNKDTWIIKQVLFIMFWESILFLYYFLAYYNRRVISENVLMYMLLFIPLTLMFIVSNILRSGLSLAPDKVANNNIFYLLTLLPWLMLLRNRALRLFFIMFIMTMCVYSLKRSAIFISAFCSAYYVYHDYLKNGKRVRSLVLGMLAVVVAILLFSYANKVSSGTAFQRIQSMEEDKGSGRLIRYMDVWELIKREKSADKILLGHGYRTVEDQLGAHKSAHNDFLEVIYDYGVIGVILFTLMHIALIRRVRYLSRIKSPVYPGYFISYVIFLIMSLVSHLVIYPTYFIFLTSYWGAVEGGLIKK